MDMAAVKGGGEDLGVFFAANLGRLVVFLFSLAWLVVCHREPGLEPCEGEIPGALGGGRRGSVEIPC